MSTDNTGSNVKMVPAICTQCGGTVEVDKDKETATCPFCGASFIIEKAINNYNINVTGAVKEVLNFAGEQMHENREAAKKTNAAFIKMMGFVFAGMLVFALIAFIVMQFTGGSREEYDAPGAESGAGESYIECTVENGCLYIDITGEDILNWEYQAFDSMGTVLSYENSDSDSYNSCVIPDGDIDEGVRYVVIAGFDEYDTSSEPVYYGVIRVTIEDHDIVDADEPVFVDSLSDYDYQ
ncbi:MAG: hypothetical protein K5673_06055 [Lachnospiraceae bacterium]|nr:hypothetical protein [Lachnospiraceae bacterium]